MKVVKWWVSLCALAAINITAWLICGATVDRHLAEVQLVLSGIYVFGCAFRSAFLVYDIPRIGVVDSWASSVLIGRTVATLAELAFAAQWAVYLHASPLDGVRLVSLGIVPLIVIAEICSWHAVLTTKNLGHVFENSLWGISAALIVICLVTTASQIPASRNLMLAVWTLGGTLYVAYIFIADVPMYWSRWQADEAQRRKYFGLWQGAIDASRCRQVSRLWKDWKSEVAWMTLYFITGVWASISLIHAAP